MSGVEKDATGGVRKGDGRHEDEVRRRVCERKKEDKRKMQDGGHVNKEGEGRSRRSQEEEFRLRSKDVKQRVSQEHRNQYG